MDTLHASRIWYKWYWELILEDLSVQLPVVVSQSEIGQYSTGMVYQYSPTEEE